jgi:hypothetical protein
MAEMTFDVAEAIVEKALTIINRQRVDPALYLSPKVFGDLMFEALLISFPRHKLTRDADLEVTFHNGDDKSIVGKAILDRLFNTFEGHDPARIWDRLIHILLEVQSMVAVFDDPKNLLDPSTDKLVPLLKLRRQVDEWNKDGAHLPGMPVGKSRVFLQWPVAGEVVMTVAIDNPKTYAFITGAQLLTLDLSMDGARKKALDNLRSMLRKTAPKTNYRKGIVEITGVGGLASSLILLEDFWQQEALKARDALVIFAQDYDRLLVARRGDHYTCRSLALAYGTGQMKLIFNGAIFVFDQSGMRQARPADFI